jgi:hypothetical protein
MIAITLIPLVAVSAVTIARSTPAQPRAVKIVPAGITGAACVAGRCADNAVCRRKPGCG